MVVKILIFNLFLILIALSTVLSGKTIFGKARVIDGDTIDVDIDLGFGVWLKKQE